MEYTSQVVQLTPLFYQTYPQAQFPELLYKLTRPYQCLLISVNDFFLCIPFRSHIHHNQYSFLFRTSCRSRQSKSGLDFTKMVIVQNPQYITAKTAVVDQDEYKETMQNMSLIVQKASAYLNGYLDHHRGTKQLSPQEYQRKYGYSTLPYFHKELGLSSTSVSSKTPA